MSENLRSPEHEEQPVAPEVQDDAHENASEVQPEPQEAPPQAEVIRKNVEAAEQHSSETEAIKKSLEIRPAEDAEPQPASRELKKLMLDRTLNRVQRQLPKPERVLSKIVHQPAIDRLSELGGKTIGRPSGILSGGLFALLGSVVYLYITKHYGYQYNYLLFALLFVGGFFVGLIIELLLSIFSGRKKRS